MFTKTWVFCKWMSVISSTRTFSEVQNSSTLFSLGGVYPCAGFLYPCHDNRCPVTNPASPGCDVTERSGAACSPCRSPRCSKGGVDAEAACPWFTSHSQNPCGRLWYPPTDHGRLARWRKWRACDVGEAKERLENELWRRWSNERVGEWALK